jgi:hypothetical protein
MINGKKRGTIRTHWHADDLLKQCPSKGDKYVIDEELHHIDHLFFELDQDYEKIRLIRSLKKFIFRYRDLVEIYSDSAETMVGDAFLHSENV